MNTKVIKSVVLFSGALILAGLFAWIGYKCLFTTFTDLEPEILFLFGVAACFGGVFAMGSEGAGNRLAVGGLPIICGLYLFARAAGMIDQPWLMRVIGVVFWLAAAVLVYVTLPRNPKTTV